MSSQYAGDPNSFPTDFTILDDSDPPTASTWNIAYEALGDRSAYLYARQALNFTTLEPLTDCEQIIFAAGTQRWWTCGGTKIVKSSLSGGWQFDAATVIPGGFSALSLKSIAADSAGNLITVAQTSATYFELNASTGTWAERSTMTATADPYIVFDPVAGLYAVAGNNGLGNIRVLTTADRIAWITRTLPAGLGDSITSLQLTRIATSGTGRTVLVRGPYNAAASEERVRVGYSSDGGASWTYAGQIDTDITVEQTPIPVSNGHPFSPVWLMALYRTTGLPASRVYRSTNGATWDLVTSLSSVAIISIACFRGDWIGLTSTGELLSSKDNGATWRRMLARVETPAKAVFGSPYGVLAVGNDAVWPSSRGANDSLAAVT